jgi:DNA-binding transcriptional ArsR family regulator
VRSQSTCVDAVARGTGPDPAMLKPSPHLVLKAIRALAAEPGCQSRLRFSRVAERAAPPWMNNQSQDRAFAGIRTRPFASTNFRVGGQSPIVAELLVRVAERLRVLGQPVRLRLIEQLTAGPSTPQELSEIIGTSQQNVSKHLLVLYRAGVVSRRPEGSNVYYSLADSSARAVLDEMLTSVKRQLRELSELATQPPDEA